MKRTITAAFGSLTYTLTYKKIRRVNLRVKADGKVMVSAPVGTDNVWIDRFVERHQARIVAAQSKLKAREQLKAWPEMFKDGEPIRIDGVMRRLFLVKDTAEGVRLAENQLYLHVKDDQNSIRCKKVLDDWVKARMADRCQKAATLVHSMFKKGSVPMPVITLRKMTSRWGSCRPAKGRVTMNTALVQAPEVLTTYVMLHEFCHFIEPNHSPAFYALLDARMPDWRVYKNYLDTTICL